MVMPVSANFFYSIDKNGENIYHNKIKNVPYQGGFSERVGALRICGSRSQYQVATFVGKRCDKVITTAHAFFMDNGVLNCKGDSSNGKLRKLARRNTDNLSNEQMAADKWHGGLDPSHKSSYVIVSKDISYMRMIEPDLYNGKASADGGIFNAGQVHQDLQLLKLNSPAPVSDIGKSKGHKNACDGSLMRKPISASLIQKKLPLNQCYIMTRFQKEEQTGVKQNGRSQISIYSNIEPCHVTGLVKENTTGRLFKHNCPTGAASSGAPIQCAIDGEMRIVGIHHGIPGGLKSNIVKAPQKYDHNNYNIMVGFSRDFVNIADK